MKPSELYNRLVRYFSSDDKVPIFIWGPPGIGKSQIVGQATEKLMYELRTMIASTVDPVDIRGVMGIVDAMTVWFKPDFFRKSRIPVVYFFDELNTATPATQVAFYRLILEGKLDNIDISDCIRIGAGNRATDFAAVNRMPAPLVNRFHHFHLDVDFDDWRIWAYKHDIHPLIMAYHNFKSGATLSAAPVDRDKPFPTPRSWEYLSRTIKILGGVEQLTHEDVAGDVGDGVAAEFMGFLKVYSTLPQSADEIVGKRIMFPKEPSKQAALNGMLVSWFKKSSQRASTADLILQYASHLEKKEFAVLLIRDMMRLDMTAVKSASGFVEWANDVKELVL